MRTGGALLLGFALAVSLLTIAQAAEWQAYLEEDFSAPQTMFYTGQAGEAQYSIDEMGRYVIDGINTGSDSLSSLTDNLYYYYLEAQCEVDKTIAGEQAFTGVVFHYNKSIPGKLSYYVFYVFGDGYYGAKRVIGDQVDIIIPLTPTDQLDLYGVNVLAVDAQGTSFDLYLNGRFIDGFTDVRIDGGGFGFYVSKHARAAFDNFKVKVERRGGGPEDMPAAVTSNVADEGGTAAADEFRDYSFPVIPKDPNRPTYSWEVGVDKTRKAKPAGEEPAAEPEPDPEPGSVPVVEAPPAARPEPVEPAEAEPQAEPEPAHVEPAAEPSATDGTESLRSVQPRPGEELVELTPAPTASQPAAKSDGAVDWVAERINESPLPAQNEGEAQDITPVQAAEEITLLPAPEPEAEPEPEPEATAPVQLPVIAVPSIDVPELPRPGRGAASTPAGNEPIAVDDAAAEPEPAAAAEPEPEPAAVIPAPVIPEIEYTDAEPAEELALFPAELVAEALEPAPVTGPALEDDEPETSPAPVVEEATPEQTAPEMDNAAVEPHVDEEGELSVYSALPADAPLDVAPDEEPAAEPEPAMELSLPPEQEHPVPEPEPEPAPVIEEPAPAEPETLPAAAEITPAAEEITPVVVEETPVAQTAAPESAELALFPTEPEPADEGTLGAQLEKLAEREAAHPATDDAEPFEPQQPVEQVTEPEAPEAQAGSLDAAESEPIADDQPGEEETPSWSETADAMRDHGEWGATDIYKPAEPEEPPADTPAAETAPAETPADGAADGDAVPAVEADAEGELRFASVEPKLEDLGVGGVPDAATPISELDWRPVPLEPAAAEAGTPLQPAIEPADEYYSGEGLVVIADDFGAQRWPISTDGSETYRYFGSAYEIDNLNAETMAISFQDSALADSEFSVDIEFLDGVGYVGYGVASRLGVVNGVVSYYGLFICQNGELMLLKVHGGGEQVLVDWQATNLIRANQTNRIALDVRDGLLYAYINGALAATATDSEILSGGYALLAGPGVAVRFDNLRIHGFAP